MSRNLRQTGVFAFEGAGDAEGSRALRAFGGCEARARRSRSHDVSGDVGGARSAAAGWPAHVTDPLFARALAWRVVRLRVTMERLSLAR